MPCTGRHLGERHVGQLEHRRAGREAVGHRLEEGLVAGVAAVDAGVVGPVGGRRLVEQPDDQQHDGDGAGEERGHAPAAAVLQRATSRSATTATAASAQNAITTEMRFQARISRRPMADRRNEYELMAPTSIDTRARKPRPMSNRPVRPLHQPVALRSSALITNTTTMSDRPRAPMTPSCWPFSDGTTAPVLSSASWASAGMRWSRLGA